MRWLNKNTLFQKKRKNNDTFVNNLNFSVNRPTIQKIIINF